MYLQPDLGSVSETKTFDYKHEKEKYSVKLELFDDDSFTITTIMKGTKRKFIQNRVSNDMEDNGMPIFDILFTVLRGKEKDFTFKRFEIDEENEELVMEVTYPHRVSKNIKKIVIFNLKEVEKPKAKQKKEVKKTEQVYVKPSKNEPVKEPKSNKKKKRNVIEM